MGLKHIYIRPSDASASQCKAANTGRQFLLYGVVILEFFLLRFNIIERHNHFNAFGNKHYKGVNQRLGRLVADV